MKTKAEYLDAPGHCPSCDSDEIEGLSIEIEYNLALQPVTCLSCNFKWTDIYTLSSYFAHEPTNQPQGGSSEIQVFT